MIDLTPFINALILIVASAVSIYVLPIIKKKLNTDALEK